MYLVSNQFFIFHTIPCTTFHHFDLNNNNLLSLLFFFYILLRNNNNCSLDLYNRDLQTTIIRFTRNLSSHKTDWIFFELPFSGSVLPFIPPFICLGEISINVNKLFIVTFVFCLHCPCSCCCCLFTCLSPFLDSDVVAIFLFMHWSCRQAYYFCFWSFCL